MNRKRAQERPRKTRASHDGHARLSPDRRTRAASNGRAPLAIAKVSHTLDGDLAERLEVFAFRLRISESSVIEFALRQFFKTGDEQRLASVLLRNGAARRRRNINGKAATQQRGSLFAAERSSQGSEKRS